MNAARDRDRAWAPRPTSSTASIDRLRELDVAASTAAPRPCFASTLAIEERLPEADLVIGAVLVHGAKAPHVVTREQLGLMKRNAVLVDVSIDQGGCFETSRPTTHSDPTYEVDGITHYCVANMPGAVPITSHLRADQRDDALRASSSPTAGCTARWPTTPGFLQGPRTSPPAGSRPSRRRDRSAPRRVAAEEALVASPRGRRAAACQAGRARREARPAATMRRRMPTTCQLIRKGRSAKPRSSRPRA